MLPALPAPASRLPLSWELGISSWVYPERVCCQGGWTEATPDTWTGSGVCLGGDVSWPPLPTKRRSWWAEVGPAVALPQRQSLVLAQQSQAAKGTR